MEKTVARVFQNGHGEWVRWLLSMAVGAGIVYGIVSTRLNALDNRVGVLIEDVRELRTELFRRSGGGQ